MLAGNKLLFQIIASEIPANVDCILCLNGKGSLFCQNHNVSALNLTILAMSLIIFIRV